MTALTDAVTALLKGAGFDKAMYRNLPARNTDGFDARPVPRTAAVSVRHMPSSYASAATAANRRHVMTARYAETLRAGGYQVEVLAGPDRLVVTEAGDGMPGGCAL